MNIINLINIEMAKPTTLVCCRPFLHSKVKAELVVTELLSPTGDSYQIYSCPVCGSTDLELDGGFHDRTEKNPVGIAPPGFARFPISVLN